MEDLPVRRKDAYGESKFRKITIKTNYYPAKLKNVNMIYIYKTVITPAIMYDDKITRNRIFEAIYPNLKSQIGMNILIQLIRFFVEPMFIHLSLPQSKKLNMKLSHIKY